MAEERIITTDPAAPATATHTTVIRDSGRSGGSGVGILFALVLLVAVIAGVYLFSQNSSSETAKDNAIAQAADQVGETAAKVGNAVDSAAENAADKAN